MHRFYCPDRFTMWASKRKGGFRHARARWPANCCPVLPALPTLLFSNRQGGLSALHRDQVTHDCLVCVCFLLRTKVTLRATCCRGRLAACSRSNRDGGGPVIKWPGSLPRRRRFVRHATCPAGFEPLRRLSTPHGLPAYPVRLGPHEPCRCQGVRIEHM